MGPNELIWVAVVAVVVLMVWTEAMLQIVGMAMFAVSPFVLVAPGYGAVFGIMAAAGMAFAGLVLIALGRICYHVNRTHHLARAANPEASGQVRMTYPIGRPKYYQRS